MYWFPQIYILLFSFYGTSAYSLPSINNLHSTKSIDRKIFQTLKPTVVNYVMVPVVSMIDTIWITKMGSSKQLAGSGTGDQVYSIMYTAVSFLPTIIVPLLAQHIDKKEESTQIISISINITLMLGLALSASLFMRPDFYIDKFVGGSSEVINYSKDFLKYRGAGMLFSLLNSVLFSILRTRDQFKAALTISIVTQIVNAILDPLGMILFGIKGIAGCTVFSEWLCTLFYIRIILKQELYTFNIDRPIQKAYSLFKIGAAICTRNTIFQIAYLAINKRIIEFDITGVALATNTFMVRIIEICNIAYASLSSVANFLVASESKLDNSKRLRDRLVLWTTTVGLIQTVFILSNRPFLRSLISDNSTCNLALQICPYVAIYQLLAGVSIVIEGILQGYQRFRIASLGSILSALILLSSMHCAGNLKVVWQYCITASIFKILFSLCLNTKYLLTRK